MLKKQVNNKVIIIRKRKSNMSDQAFHGGSWKLAYADFVTALMAFFLLLWLLTAVPNKKLKIIAEYFMPTLDFLKKEGSKDAHYNEKIGIKDGVSRVGDIVDISRKGEKIDVSEMENKVLAEIESKIGKIQKKDISINETLSYYKTANGLEITVYDYDKYKVFNQENTELTDFGKSILTKISNTIKISPNLIQVIGYSRMKSTPMEHYGSWELSADRANVARKFLLVNGVSPDKIQEVVGRINLTPSTDSSYLGKDAKITITILRNSTILNEKVSVPLDSK